jgi:kynurenine formamidase
MERFMRTVVAKIFLGICMTVLMASSLPSQENTPSHKVTQADMDRWLKDLSNWGRWGTDDQKGALNLITAAKMKQAAALVKEGFAVSLAGNMDTQKAVDNPEPFEDVFVRDGSTGYAVSDRISDAYHSGVTTHIDALGHRLMNSRMYNGYPVKDYVTMQGGLTRDSIINMKDGVFTRGILMDIPRLKGVPYLEPGTPIYVEDLQAWEKQAAVKVTAGDAVFISTGRFVRRAKLGPWAVTKQTAGLDASVIPWLKERGVALIGSDATLSVRPASSTTQIKDPDEVHPAHDFALYGLGIPVIDDCDFRALSEAAASRKRWEFLLTAAPLPIPNGAGSPINPIAIF